MGWLVGGSYACSLVLYLFVKRYYENELEVSAGDSSFGHDLCHGHRGLFRFYVALAFLLFCFCRQQCAAPMMKQACNSTNVNMPLRFDSGTVVAV